MPLSLAPEVAADATLVAEIVRLDTSQATIRSLAMDFRQPPFDDVRVRRAFGMAIDRDRYAEIYSGTWTPATVFTPPVVFELSGYQPPDGFPFDLDQARALLAEAGYPDGQGLPEIIYYQPSGDTDEELQRVRAFLQMFEENLGVLITLDDTRSQTQINELIAETGGLQFAVMWWQTVTDTPFLHERRVAPRFALHARRLQLVAGARTAGRRSRRGGGVVYRSRHAGRRRAGWRDAQ